MENTKENKTKIETKKAERDSTVINYYVLKKSGESDANAGKKS